MENTLEYLLKFMGAKFKEFRENAKISQEHCAIQLDLTRASIINIETGRQGIKHLTLMKACKLFKRYPHNFYPSEHEFSPPLTLIDYNSLAKNKKEALINRLEAKLKKLKED